MVYEYVFYPHEDFNTLRAGCSSGATWDVLCDDAEGAALSCLATVILKYKRGA